MSNAGILGLAVPLQNRIIFARRFYLFLIFVLKKIHGAALFWFCVFLNQTFMRSVNKVVLVGHLATDPELKTTTSGQAMAKFKIATNRDWKSSDGEHHQDTDFHKIVTWRRLAEICGKHLKKGAGIYLEGRLMNRNYKDKEGADRSLTEIVADTIHFLTFKKNKDVEEVNLVEVPAT
jgi:single-strand DNA-binding protein